MPGAKITLSRTAICRDLEIAASLIPGKPTFPILENVILVVKDGKLWLRTSNLDSELYSVCEAEGGAGASIGIRAKKFKEIANLLPADRFDLYVNASTVRIECGRSHFTLPAVSPENFPEAHRKPDKSITLPANFKDLINSVSVSITDEETRHAIKGAKLEIRNDGRLRMIATNGSTVSLAETDCKPGTDLDIVLSGQSLEVLAKLLEGKSCVMQYEDNLVWFKVGGRILSTRTLKTVFPKYEKILPSHTTCATVNRREFAKALSRTRICADELSQAIRLIFSQDAIKLRARSQEAGESEEAVRVNEAEDVIPAKLDLARPLEIGVNAQYLRNFLAAVPGSEILIYFDGPTSPLDLRPVGCAWTHRTIISPMRL